MKKSSLKHYVMLLETELEVAVHDRNYWMGKYDLEAEILANASDEIAELRRRLDDNGGLCTLRAKLIGETCKETNDRLREDNERLSRLLQFHRRNHAFERDHNDPQA